MDEDTPELPGSLRLLKTLVTVLTLVMIGGVVTVVALLVMRLGGTAPPLPSEIALPSGQNAVSFTQGPDFYAVVTDANEILIFDLLTGDLRQTIAISDPE